MTVRFRTPNPLRAAIEAVRGNPAGVAALDAEDAATAKAVAAEAKAKADRLAKVEKALPDRVQALLEDYVAREQEALHAAAESLARQQLERELGVIPPAVAAATWPPARLDRG